MIYKMDLTVIIPIYNTGKYLDECIQSLDLEHNDIEVILVDDGSTDDSYSIAKQYSSETVKLFSKPNGGVSSARNIGLRQATRKYIMFLDSDDKFIKTWATKIQSILETDCDIAYFSKKISRYYSNFELLKLLLGQGEFVYSGCCSKLFKRDLIVNNGIFFNNKIINGEDLLFNIACLNYSKKQIFIPESFYLYRQNLQSLTHSSNEYFIKSNFLFFEELELLLNESTVVDQHQRERIINNAIFSSIYLMVNKYNLEKSENARQAVKQLINQVNLKSATFNMRYLLAYFLCKLRCFFILSCLRNFKNKLNSFKAGQRWIII